MLVGEMLVPAVVVSMLEGLCLRHGVAPSAIFSAAGVDLVELKRGKDGFSAEQSERVMDELIVASGINHMGLCLGQTLQIESLGLFGPLIASCATPRQAITTFSQYKRLLHGTLDIQLTEYKEYGVIRYASNDELPIGIKPYYAEAILSAVVMLGGLFLGHPIQPTKVYFRHAQPSYQEEYDKIFGCPIFFNQSYDGIYCDNKLLDQPMISGNAAYNADLLCQGSEALKLFGASSVQLVVDILRHNIHLPGFGLQQIADVLCVSPRTLQRELKKHNIRFSDIKNQIRFDYAKELLLQKTVTIGQIADQLGYSDRSNFVHAFRRWSGLSPSEYQKSC